MGLILAVPCAVNYYFGLDHSAAVLLAVSVKRISLVGNGSHNVMCFNYSFHLKQKVFHLMCRAAL